MYKFVYLFIFLSVSFLNAQTVDVTFNVDMQNEVISPDGVHIAGSFQNWVPSTTQLYDIDGDSVFSITITLFSDSVYEYKYINGNSWGNDEYVLGSCSPGNGNRTLQTDTTTQSLTPVLFNSCINSHLGCMDATAINYDSTALSDDGSCSYLVSVEFNVDMNNEVISPFGVYISGTFTSWSTDSIEMLDVNGDGIYSVSINLNPDWYYEYKYLNGDSWGTDEFLAGWESCSNGGGNRTLNTDTSLTQVLSVVCFSSCATCAIYGCTDPSATNYNSIATIDDGSCTYQLYGCMDIFSCNYNPNAIIDDGSCYYLSIDLGNDTTLCSSATMNLEVNNNYSSYLWNTLDTTPQITISSNGVYSVLVSDSLGCVVSDTIVVSLSFLPLVDIGNDQKLCPGESLILDAGSDWNNYFWSDSSTLQTFEVDTSGLFYVIVTDSLGCQGSDYVNITMDTLSVAGFTYTINGLTVDFIDTSSFAISYLWDFMSDGAFTDTTSGDISFTYQSSGVFDVTLLVSNHCGTDTFTSRIDLITSDVATINSNFQIYPNPSQNKIYIELDKLSTYSQLKIADLNGKIVYSQQIKNIKSILDLSSLCEGVYLITIDNRESITHQKLVLY